MPADAQARLLRDADVQRFVVDGYLLVDATVDEAVHDAVKRKLDEHQVHVRNPGNNILALIPELHDVVGSPAVQGALQSVLGRNFCMLHHRYAHANVPGSIAQGWHRDAYAAGYLRRHHAPRFCMLMYYPQEVTLDNGPTQVLRGSQNLTAVHHHTLLEHARAHDSGFGGPGTGRPCAGGPQPPNSWGDRVDLCVPKGSVVLMSFDLWHRAWANVSPKGDGGAVRYMIKVQFVRTEEPASAAGPSWDFQRRAWSYLAGPCDGGKLHPSERSLQHVWRATWRWMLGRALGDGDGDTDDGLSAAIDARHAPPTASSKGATKSLGWANGRAGCVLPHECTGRHPAAFVARRAGSRRFLASGRIARVDGEPRLMYVPRIEGDAAPGTAWVSQDELERLVDERWSALLQDERAAARDGAGFEDETGREARKAPKRPRDVSDPRSEWDEFFWNALELRIVDGTPWDCEPESLGLAYGGSMSDAELLAVMTDPSQSTSECAASAARSASYGLALGASWTQETMGRVLDELERGAHHVRVQEQLLFVAAERVAQCPAADDRLLAVCDRAIARSGSDPTRLVVCAALDALGLLAGLGRCTPERRARARELMLAPLRLAGDGAGESRASADYFFLQRPDARVHQVAALSVMRACASTRGALLGAGAPRAAALAALARVASSSPCRYARGHALDALAACGPDGARALVPLLLRSRWCPLTSAAAPF